MLHKLKFCLLSLFWGLNFPKFSVMFKIILKYVAYFMHCNFEMKVVEVMRSINYTGKYDNHNALLH